MTNRFRTLLALAVGAVIPLAAGAQSYYDDDIYFDASKAKKQTPAVTTQKVTQTYVTPTSVVVAEYPSADSYSVEGTRNISVDDYNRRGIFASDSLSNDTTTTDFTYTRRIEQFYNPDIVAGSGDSELANIYYMQPERVNIYINTPNPYWGYDYFYPDFYWYNSPAWAAYPWRWTSSWYWRSWYDPYWDWGPAWGWGWGRPSWGWHHGWYLGWGHSWGWAGPAGWSRPNNPRHPGAVNNGYYRPGYGSGMSSSSSRPSSTSGRSGLGSGTRNQGSAGYYRPGGTQSNSGRPGTTTTTRPSSGSNSSGSYSRPSVSNGGRTGSYNNGASSSGGGRSSGSSFGGSRSSGSSSSGRSSGGGRGRH
ncbi:MAG: hypothetical protein J1E29_06645 [Duncaniella sp.]|nr:hypothetical protein [Duncaniella sp.]